MQEKTAPVFMVMTANDVEVLPAELLRKGRLDELFFLHLPTLAEREQIFEVHLSRVRPDRIAEFDLGLLATSTKDFSGAEIEQVIYAAMQFAFSSGEEFVEDDILDAIADTVPLAKIAQPQIDALKSWAVRSNAKSASIEEMNLIKPNASLLQVDVEPN